MNANEWALVHIKKLLPLDDESLKQIVEYSSNLSPEAAAEHLKGILGDSPPALEFISSYNARRNVSTRPAVAQASGVPRHQKKSKPPLHKLPPPRRPEDYGNIQGAYQKKDEEDYMASSSSKNTTNSTFSLSTTPAARQQPTVTAPVPKPPPSAMGSLISDLPNVRSRTTSRNPSRTASPASGSATPQKTKVSISGGTPMHGASSTLADLDSAIRALELQTNPSIASASDPARACDCQATRHALLAAAPNCTACGKIICVKEGLGPCTFCHNPILSQSEIQSMIQSLREERGIERMNVNNSSNRRAEVAGPTKYFQPTTSAASPALNPAITGDATLSAALSHRDKLLNYQSQNAKRTQIHDEASDFETPSSGTNMWSTPVERAAQLKRQQKVLREQEWSAKPEWEKRQVVVSVDLVGGKVVRRMGEIKREEVAATADEDDNDGAGIDGNIPYQDSTRSATEHGKTSGAFSKNPLLGSLIRPVWKDKGKGRGTDDGEANKDNRGRETMWRRVQDDMDDNEDIILNGGVYGGMEAERMVGDEPACG